MSGSAPDDVASLMEAPRRQAERIGALMAAGAAPR
jgi:hypothetical protein